MTKQPFKKIMFFGVIFFWLLENLYSQPLSADMQRLCAASEQMAFAPSIEVMRSPSKNPLLKGIEIGSDFEETTRLLADRHPDSIITLDATPLFFASVAGNLQAVKALLTAGADINYKMPTGATPLVMAVINSQFPMACSLIENGSKLPTSIGERNRLIRHAIAMEPRQAEWGAIFVEYLLLNGFDVDDDGSERETPLMSAVSLHNIPVIKVLLKHGARLDIVKQGGRTVWLVATEKNNPRVLQLLKEAQEKVDAAKKVKAPELVHQ